MRQRRFNYVQLASLTLLTINGKEALQGNLGPWNAEFPMFAFFFTSETQYMPQMDFFTIDEKSSLPLTFWQIPTLENNNINNAEDHF